MKRYVYIFFVVVCFWVPAFAGKPPIKLALPKKPAVLKVDSSTIEVRRFDKKSIEAYSKQPDFQYKEGAKGPSLWQRFWRWFWHLFDGINLSPKAGSLFGLFLKYLFIALGLGAIIFLILRLAGVDMSNIFSRKSKSAPLNYSEFSENIHEIDFDAELENAIAQHNYRFAVRLLYLKSLKQLSDAGLIKWQPDKTNSTYVDELANTDQRIAFSMLTRQFEYVWYGEFLIDNQVFQHINGMFQDFKSRVA